MTDRAAMPWRWLGWGGAAGLLLVPLVAGAPWTTADYAVAAGMLALAGGAVEVAVRRSGNAHTLAGTLVAVAATFLLVWVNAAVGLLGDENNDANAVFALVPLVAIGGSALGRFRAPGAARAMVAAAVVQVAAAVVGRALGWAAPGGQGTYEVAVGSALFGTLWLVAAALFATGSRAHSRTASPSI